MDSSELKVEAAAQPSEGCCGGSCGSGSANEAPADIDSAIRERYGRVALKAAEDVSDAPEPCCAPPGTYSGEELESLVGNAQAASAGCGNPVGLAEARTGEVVLDLGSGGGIDCFLAAQKVGESGKVIGVDMTGEMVELARANAAKMDATNVEFKLGKIETIPQADDSVDLVISNCVISLVVPEKKDLVFQDIYRVLKPGGRFVISDMVAEDELPEEVRNSTRSWVACIAGADQQGLFLERIGKAGFEKIEILESRRVSDGELAEAGADRTSVVNSITVRAYKPQSA